VVSPYALIGFCIIGYIVTTITAILIFNRTIRTTKIQSINQPEDPNQIPLNEQYFIEQDTMTNHK
jgi:hypothetical protein